jgi:tripartite-type tricarboxylate transporter receptor subunit TctC
MFKPLKPFISALLIAMAPFAIAQQSGIPPLVRIVVPVSAGASTDIMARKVAPLLAARLGTNVIVENRPGATGLIGAAAVSKGPADGSILLLFSTSMITAGATMRNPPLDVIKDLTPVAALAENPLVVVVSTKTDIKTPADLVAAARARPDMITHGHGGIGSTAHLAAELFSDAARIQLRHVPYKGAAPAVIDMSSGIIDMMISTNSTVVAQTKAGRARLIAVTSREPSPSFPDLPTMASAVPGFSADLWVGVWTSNGTPPALIQRYNRELVEIARAKEVQDLMQLDGGVPLAWTPAEFATRVRESYDAFKRIASTRSIVME